VLGWLRPHPTTPGAAAVRMRRVERADAMVDGVVLARRIEAWLEIDGWWLRVAVSDDVESPPKVDRAAARTTGLLAALSVTLFAGVVSALAAVPARQASLDLERLAPPVTPRLPTVEIMPPDHAEEPLETKHDVEPRPAGGREVMNVEAPARPRPSRERAGPRVRGRGAIAGGQGGLSRLTAAATALQTLGGQSPYDPDAAGPRALGTADRDAWLQLATLTGSTGSLDESSATSVGPLQTGWGSGYGDVHIPQRRRPIPRVQPIHWHDCHVWFLTAGGWSCRPARDHWAQIRAVVRAHLDEMRFCYTQARLHTPELQGHITLQWIVEPDGSVSDVSVAESSLPSDLATNCLRAAPRRWTFPTSNASYRVRYPFRFDAR